MFYSFGVILLCRPHGITAAPTETLPWGDRTKAGAAANEITRVMEDILSTSVVQLCQIHTWVHCLYSCLRLNPELTQFRIPSLFNSLSMHVYTLCTSGPVGRELAENRARICMLGLACLQESWPVSGWILKLFVDIIDRLRRKLMSQPQSSDTSLVGSSNSSGGRAQPRQLPAPASQNALSPPPEYNEDEFSGGPAAQSTQAGGTVDARDPFGFSLPNDSAWGNNAGAELFPNLFVLDELFPDSNAGQVNFFDLLEVPSHGYPDWQNPNRQLD